MESFSKGRILPCKSTQKLTRETKTFLTELPPLNVYSTLSTIVWLMSVSSNGSLSVRVHRNATMSKWRILPCKSTQKLTREAKTFLTVLPPLNVYSTLSTIEWLMSVSSNGSLSGRVHRNATMSAAECLDCIVCDSKWIHRTIWIKKRKKYYRVIKSIVYMTFSCIAEKGKLTELNKEIAVVFSFFFFFLIYIWLFYR